MLNILPRRLPKEVVAGEHFVLQDLPFYVAVQKADARKRKARLTKREKKRQEGVLRKARGDKQPNVLSTRWRSSKEEEEEGF